MHQATLVIFVCVFAAVKPLSDQFKEKFMEKMTVIGEKCSEETGASADDIAHILKKEKPTTHEGKCMLFCGHKEFNIQKEDGSLDLDGAIASLDELKADDADLHAKLVEVFKFCGSTPTDSDPCEFATALSDCGVKKAEELGVDASLLE